jgi:hypothetical protein
MQLNNAPCTNIIEATTPIAIRLPDKTLMCNTHEGLLNLIYNVKKNKKYGADGV